MKHKTFTWYKNKVNVYYSIVIFKNGKIRMPKEMETDIIELITIIANKRRDMIGYKYDKNEIISMLWIKTNKILIDLKEGKGNIKTFLSTCYENYIMNLNKKKLWECSVSNYIRPDDKVTEQELFERLIHEKARNTD